MSEITESWKDKTYEGKLTEFYFNSLKILTESQAKPVLENLRVAHSVIQGLAYGLIYSKIFLEEFEKEIKPVPVSYTHLTLPTILLV